MFVPKFCAFLSRWRGQPELRKDFESFIKVYKKNTLLKNIDFS